MWRFSGFFLFIVYLTASASLAQTDSVAYFFGKNEGNQPKTYVLTGRLIDKLSGDPVEGVGVSLDGIFTGITSDRFGTYLVKVAPGNHKVTFRHLSKIPIFIQVTSYANGVVNLEMQEN
mgnify:FL=1